MQKSMRRGNGFWFDIKGGLISHIWLMEACQILSAAPSGFSVMVFIYHVVHRPIFRDGIPLISFFFKPHKRSGRVVIKLGLLYIKAIIH